MNREDCAENSPHREDKKLMLDEVRRYLDSGMTLLPEGIEVIRDFKDYEKWISSNSQMSMSGYKGNKTESVCEVPIRPFYLSEFPVTASLYRSITSGLDLELNNRIPVVNISWNEAVLFCNSLSLAMGLNPCYEFDNEMSTVVFDCTQLGFRLPTDAEWQYACRAGSKGYRYGELEAIGWYQDNSQGHVHPVGEKTPNAWGLYDMLGNVWEWCWDLYDEELYGSYRIFRGGSWAEDDRGVGATCRRRSFPSFQIDDLGFRIARSA